MVAVSHRFENKNVSNKSPSWATTKKNDWTCVNKSNPATFSDWQSESRPVVHFPQKNSIVAYDFVFHEQPTSKLL